MNRYQPIEVPMLLFGVLSEAVPELLEQHHRYEESRLTKFLAEYYPEIPENLRGPIVTAASLGAKRAALMHTVAEKNLHSDNPEKDVLLLKPPILYHSGRQGCVLHFVLIVFLTMLLRRLCRLRECCLVLCWLSPQLSVPLWFLKVRLLVRYWHLLNNLCQCLYLIRNLRRDLVVFIL